MTAMILAVISLLAVYSSISSLAFKREGGSTLHFLMKHGIMLVTGGVIMYYASMLKYSMYSRLSQLAISIVAGLLLLTLLLGSNINDASRWITIPIINQSFQTSDLAKVVLIVYLARVIGKQQDKEWTFRDVLVNLMVPVGVICGLILPANFSTAALLFLLCMIIMFIGEVPIKWLLAIVGLAVGSFVLLVMANEALELDVLPRVETWTNRVSNFGGDDRNANYQVEHAKIAIASGGLLPNGPGSGNSRNWLPHPYSDMIYAFIIEEYGSIIGGLGLLLLYLILLFRAVKIAGRCDKKFGSLVAVGLSLMLVLQAMINMAVAVDLVPVTGQPLPLVSMGGTSVWFTCLAIGIVLSVSRSIDDIQIIKKDAKPRTAVA
ncbi:MAG TPA: FtsW/RodA/SpoVE family cell cycle protein [Flavobacteriales bacterium]|nr:FtsW/RodA/SpoVE family cell cycle protein [Flavobacteriales bacterium]HQX28564.1 FtsW/RodA/SpoVE family cell cycle protein [Flavobacteriales bacterium]HQX37539.1 FtsW/RodA/SpoVE family cell cycle protein [Flavobacteriales bacterium]HQZ91816.1 FtsW/RodA/SpoVE family cell cycle protein [Flavobacteriales bacterium]